MATSTVISQIAAAVSAGSVAAVLGMLGFSCIVFNGGLIVIANLVSSVVMTLNGFFGHRF